jgi:hypothetical protein
MTKLEISETEYTPYILLDPEDRKIVIRGNSFPENTFEFYKSVISWLDNFFAQESKEKITVEFEINYFNSSSSQLFFQLFDTFDDVASKGTSLEISWIYEEDNSSAEEAGEDFIEEYEDLSIKLVIKEN